MAHYVKNIWTDNVTPVDKAHMDVIENGLIEAADLYYLGDWVAGTYKEGDIVVYNGVAYMAVRQTTQTPVPWAAGQAALSYGTTLPSNPVDGQEAVLVDSVANPSYTWRFRYNAGSTSAYKWEFVGGNPALNDTGATNDFTQSTTYTDLSAVGPQITVPRVGDYQVSIGAQIYNDAGGQTAYMSYQIGATAAADSDCVQASQPNGVTLAGSGFYARASRKTFTSAPVALVGKYKRSSTTGNAWYQYRWMQVTPVRVS